MKLILGVTSVVCIAVILPLAQFVPSFCCCGRSLSQANKSNQRMNPLVVVIPDFSCSKVKALVCPLVYLQN